VALPPANGSSSEKVVRGGDRAVCRPPSRLDCPPLEQELV
jgi:hypothetical protein